MVGCSAAAAGLAMAPLTTMCCCGTPCVDPLAVVLCGLGIAVAVTRGQPSSLPLLASIVSLPYFVLWTWLSLPLLVPGSWATLSQPDWATGAQVGVTTAVSLWHLANCALMACVAREVGRRAPIPESLDRVAAPLPPPAPETPVADRMDKRNGRSGSIGVRESE